MTRLDRLFVGYSYDRIGPHFLLDDLSDNKRAKMYFDSKIMSIEKTDERFCVGTYDLSTFSTSPCEHHSILENSQKGVNCKECQYKIGFNPAFYNAKSISPQQAQYNATPHVVYMAYFSPNHIKVGIASERRHSIRLLEQGARAAIVLAKFPNANLARQLEARLCSKPNIIENLTSETKLKLLSKESYDFSSARDILIRAVNENYTGSPEGDVIDLSPYYFYGKPLSPFDRIYRIVNEKGAIISGKLIGMIGDLVIIAQPEYDDNVLFAVSVKKYISHVVNIFFNDIRMRYRCQPEQMTFLDLG